MKVFLVGKVTKWKDKSGENYPFQIRKINAEDEEQAISSYKANLKEPTECEIRVIKVFK